MSDDPLKAKMKKKIVGPCTWASDPTTHMGKMETLKAPDF
jgi:hypothetical protein